MSQETHEHNHQERSLEVRKSENTFFNFQDFPQEILFFILSFLTPKEFLKLALVNRLFAYFARRDNVWESFINTQFPEKVADALKTQSKVLGLALYQGYYYRRPNHRTERENYAHRYKYYANRSLYKKMQTSNPWNGERNLESEFAAAKGNNVYLVSIHDWDIETSNFITATDLSDLTPLNWAIKNGSQEVLNHVFQLHQKRGSINSKNELYWAIKLNQKNQIDKLLAEKSENIDIGGTTLLHLAAEIGQVELIKNMRGKIHTTKRNGTDDMLQEALRVAVYLGHYNVVEELIENHHAGMFVDREKISKVTLPLLGVAVGKNSADIVKKLLETKADPNKKIAVKPSYEEVYFVTPLILAAAHNDFYSVKILLEHGANPNVRESRALSYAFTPLHYAVQHNNLAMIHILLHYGAKDKRVAMFFGSSAQQLAVEQGNKPHMVMQLQQWKKFKPILEHADIKTGDSISIQLSKLFNAYAHPPLFTQHHTQNMRLAGKIADELRQQTNWDFAACKDYIMKKLTDANLTLRETGTFHALLTLLPSMKESEFFPKQELFSAPSAPHIPLTSKLVPLPLGHK